MKTLTITTAAVLLALATGPAPAANLHPLFVGKWCQGSKPTYFYFTSDDDVCANSPTQMMISPTEIKGGIVDGEPEFMCNVLSIQHSAKRGDQGVPVTLIRARCDYEGKKKINTFKLTYAPRARMWFEVK
jgi:hypothetical protein